MDDRDVGISFDFLRYIEIDVCIHIMSFIDDPADLVRASAVSRSWRQFVVKHKFAKRLCVSSFPLISSISRIHIVRGDTSFSVDDCMDWVFLVRQQEVYSSLLHALTKSKASTRDCIEDAISASSTDNYPDESVVNTLNPRERFIHRASYWSSKGKRDPETPETLIYKVRNGIWVISEIDIQPFEAFFQPGRPIYSSRFVRFRIGSLKPMYTESDLKTLPLPRPADDMFVWSYMSPVYSMAKENRLQPFVLPEPIPCVGGIVQVELLGRVQRQEMDNLFYICVCHVRVMGRPLHPAFNVELESDGKLSLKYYPEKLVSVMENIPSVDIPNREMIWERFGMLQDLLRGIDGGDNRWQAELAEIDDDIDEEEDDLV